jgi:hypothetical protein
MTTVAARFWPVMRLDNMFVAEEAFRVFKIMNKAG